MNPTWISRLLLALIALAVAFALVELAVYFSYVRVPFPSDTSRVVTHPPVLRSIVTVHGVFATRPVPAGGGVSFYIADDTKNKNRLSVRSPAPLPPAYWGSQEVTAGNAIGRELIAIGHLRHGVLFADSIIMRSSGPYHSVPSSPAPTP